MVKYHSQSSERSDIDFILMSSLIFQDVINLVVRFPIRRSPIVFMNVEICEHCNVANQIF